MKQPWFSRWAIFFVPQRIGGWVIAASAAVYAVYSFIDIDSRSHSVSDTLINFFFNLLIIAAVYSIIGFIASGRSEEEDRR